MRLSSISLCIALAACSSSKDPFGAGGDANGGHDGTTAGDGGVTDGPPARACAPTPKRVIVLGDSITACSVIGGPQAADCVSKQFSDYVIAHYGPGATYENYAVGGAKLSDLAGQLANVPANPGPSLVVVYMGGNDLAPFIFQSDQAALAAWDQIKVNMMSVWHDTLATLANPAKFPGGAIALMNTQYNPFDDCTAPPYNLSMTKSQILHMFNDTLGTIAAGAGDSAIIVDQFTPFLGHGHHFDVATCPHYIPGAVGWMQDIIHANAPGNADLATVMDGGADRLYRDCIH